MPPRANVWASCRTLAVRSRPLAQCLHPRVASIPATRGFADYGSNFPPRPAPDSGSIPPSIINAKAGAPNPKSIPDEISGGLETANDAALAQLQMASQGLDPFEPAVDGHRFSLPDLPLPPGTHLKNRYDPVLVQVTRLLMRDGKLSKAQRDMSMILNYLRTSSPPKVNPARPLLPGSPPAAHLPLNPVLYLSLAIDSVAPLVRIRNFSGMAGGGAALPVPVPMALRQRRRQAFMWILEVVNKKPSRGSGRTQLAHRVAEEIVAVAEGRSSVWDKRQQVHKLATSARANLNSAALRRR